MRSQRLNDKTNISLHIGWSRTSVRNPYSGPPFRHCISCCLNDKALWANSNRLPLDVESMGLLRGVMTWKSTPRLNSLSVASFMTLAKSISSSVKLGNISQLFKFFQIMNEAMHTSPLHHEDNGNHCGGLSVCQAYSKHSTHMISFNCSGL